MQGESGLGRSRDGLETAADAAALAERVGIAADRLDGIQLSPAELGAIVDVVSRKPGGSLLVFGCGNDSPFWEHVNRGGVTVFLENDPAWAASARGRVAAPIHLVRYRTRLSFWKWWLRTPLRRHLGMVLPGEVRSRRWDVVLVDGPPGWKGSHHGRMQSIYEASRLVAPGGSVFVHDCNRKPEAEAAALFLGEHRVFTSVSGPLGLLKGYAF